MYKFVKGILWVAVTGLSFALILSVAVAGHKRFEADQGYVRNQVEVWLRNHNIVYKRILFCSHYSTYGYCKVVFDNPNEPAGFVKCDKEGCYKERDMP